MKAGLVYHVNDHFQLLLGLTLLCRFNVSAWVVGPPSWVLLNYWTNFWAIKETLLFLINSLCTKIAEQKWCKCKKYFKTYTFCTNKYCPWGSLVEKFYSIIIITRVIGVASQMCKSDAAIVHKFVMIIFWLNAWLKECWLFYSLS